MHAPTMPWPQNTHFHTLSSPFKAVIHFQSQSYNYMKHHQLLRETIYWDVIIITLWELGQKNESCNITIHEQSKSETYITQSVAQQSHHGLGFPTANDRTPCSHITVIETGYCLQSDCPDFLKLMAESMPPDAETVVKSEHDQSHTDTHISWGSLVRKWHSSTKDFLLFFFFFFGDIF